jgi:ABC-type sugar transport system, periplasmic component
MLKKATAIATAALLLATSFTGFTASARDTQSKTVTPKAAVKTKLVFFNGGVELVSFWNSFFAAYNKQNKDGISVEQQYSADATNTLQIKMASGDVPDLISASVTQDMIDNKKFVDLTKESFWKKLSPEMKTYSTDVKSGKVYCIPFLQSEVGLIYNKTIFKSLGLKTPDTWAAFVSDLKIVKQKKPGVTPFYMGAKDGWMLNQMSNFTMMAPAMQKLGYTQVQKAMQSGNFSKLGWNTSASGVIATFASDLLQLQKDGLVNSDIVTATYDNQTTAFADGKAAFIGQGLWAVSNIASKTKNTSFIGITYYPTLMSGYKPSIGSTPDGDIYISSNSKSISAAKKVLYYILQNKNLKAISEAKKEPSTDPNVTSNWGILKSDVTAVTKNTKIAKLDYAFSPSGFSGDDQGRMLQALFAGAFSSPTDFASKWLAAYQKGLGK